MAASCLQVFGLCRLRITRLLPTGFPAASPNNVWVTDKQISLGFDPEIIAGEEHENKNGCGAILASFSDPDHRKRHNLSLQIGGDVPGLREMLLGDAVVLDGGDPVGTTYADQNDSAFEPSLVAIEAWAKLLGSDAQSAVRPWAYFLWSASSWVEASASIGNDWWNPQYSGKSRSNPMWGDGPHQDVTEVVGADQSIGAIIQTADAPPAASCAYGSVAASS